MTDAYRDSLIILPTVRCPYRCKFCAYHNDTPNITSERPSATFLAPDTTHLVRTKNNAIERSGELYIVNSGSFLDERQIPKEYVGWLANFIEGRGLRLVLECRADSKIEDYQDEISRLVDVTEEITFGIGVEAYREDMGNETFKRLNKGITRKQCIEQAHKLHESGCGVKAYVIIAPPWLGGPSFLTEGYRKNIDWLVETAFLTAKFAVEEMNAEIIGVSPFFPYKGTNSPIPNDWAPISVTEAAEVANQLKQILPGIRIDYTSRQIHFAFGNFFRFRGLEKPVNAKHPEQILEARENVAEICEKVFSRRGEISKQVRK